MTKEKASYILDKYENLVYKVAKHFVIDPHIYEDVISEGFVGLLESAIKYDESKDVKFITYAYKIIYCKMLSYFNKNKNYVSVNRSTSNAIITLNKLYKDLKPKYTNRYELINKLCEEMNITEYEMNNLKSISNVMSLDDVRLDLEEDVDSNILTNRIIKLHKNEYLERIYAETLYKMLLEIGVNERNSEMFVLKYVFEIPSKDLAAKYNISSSQVQNLTGTILDMIKHNNDIKELIKEYVESVNSETILLKNKK